jgi:hypothetical protein
MEQLLLSSIGPRAYFCLFILGNQRRGRDDPMVELGGEQQSDCVFVVIVIERVITFSQAVVEVE